VFNHGARSGWVINTTPQALYPRERNPAPVVKEAGEDLEPVWTSAENSPLPELDPRTVKPVTSLYTDYAVSAHDSILDYLQIQATNASATSVTAYRSARCHIPENTDLQTALFLFCFTRIQFQFVVITRTIKADHESYNISFHRLSAAVSLLGLLQYESPSLSSPLPPSRHVDYVVCNSRHLIDRPPETIFPYECILQFLTAFCRFHAISN
jgi:hypothetical protein